MQKKKESFICSAFERIDFIGSSTNLCECEKIETNIKTELITADSTIEELENIINELMQETKKEIAEDGEKISENSHWRMLQREI